MRIKEEDKWKAVFTTPEGSFELIVMFFGLTNFLATFQAIMNELLRDLINTGKVVAFIDDVIIGTETKEEHNKIVAEVIRKLKKNDLYVKPEKCKWKVREVGFLRVVIGPEGIKIEEEKGKICIGMDNTKVCQKHTKVFRIGKLLSLIYSRLCIYSQTITQYCKEGSEVGMDEKTGRSI